MFRSFLAGGFCVLCLAFVNAGNSPDIKTTIAFVQKLQTPLGGFLPGKAVKGAKPTLRATSAAIRALKYLGGEVPNKETAAKFVVGCFDKNSGGFSDVPGGKPDVFSTAVGLMAVVELKMPLAEYQEPAVRFLAENSKTFEDIRIAVAGLEAIKTDSPRAKAWLEQIEKMRNADGTYGKDLGQARDTGGAVVAVLRLKGKVPEPKTVLKVLKEGQRLNGGYGKADSELASDLETTYRVMRCFVMLKARPDDVEGIRSFVAKCRNEDGGYAVMPGEPSSVGGTYFAAIIRHWLEKK
jgi:prenyltransferase beta subunit